MKRRVSALLGHRAQVMTARLTAVSARRRSPVRTLGQGHAILDRRRIVDMNSLEPCKRLCQSSSRGGAPIDRAGITATAWAAKTARCRSRPRRPIRRQSTTPLAPARAVVARHHRVRDPAAVPLAIGILPHAFLVLEGRGLARSLARLEAGGRRRAAATRARPRARRATSAA